MQLHFRFVNSVCQFGNGHNRTISGLSGLILGIAGMGRSLPIGNGQCHINIRRYIQEANGRYLLIIKAIMIASEN